MANPILDAVFNALAVPGSGKALAKANPETLGKIIQTVTADEGSPEVQRPQTQLPTQEDIRPDFQVPGLGKLARKSNVINQNVPALQGVLPSLIGGVPKTPGIPSPAAPAEEQPITDAEVGTTEGTVDKPKSDFFKRMARLGIPLGAVIAGSLDSDLLPQAAGLSSGFVSQTLEQDKIQEKRNLKLLDAVIKADEDAKGKDDAIRKEARKTAAAFVKINEVIPDAATFSKTTDEIVKVIRQQEGLGAEGKPEPAKEFSEADIAFTMKQNNMTREQVLEALNR